MRKLLCYFIYVQVYSKPLNYYTKQSQNTQSFFTSFVQNTKTHKILAFCALGTGVLYYTYNHSGASQIHGSNPHIDPLSKIEAQINKAHVTSEADVHVTIDAPSDNPMSLEKNVNHADFINNISELDTSPVRAISPAESIDFSSRNISPIRNVSPASNVSPATPRNATDTFLNFPQYESAYTSPVHLQEYNHDNASFHITSRNSPVSDMLIGAFAEDITDRIEHRSSASYRSASAVIDVTASHILSTSTAMNAEVSVEMSKSNSQANADVSIIISQSKAHRIFESLTPNDNTIAEKYSANINGLPVQTGFFDGTAAAIQSTHTSRSSSAPATFTLSSGSASLAAYASVFTTPVSGRSSSSAENEHPTMILSSGSASSVDTWNLPQYTAVPNVNRPLSLHDSFSVLAAPSVLHHNSTESFSEQNLQRAYDIISPKNNTQINSEISGFFNDHTVDVADTIFVTPTSIRSSSASQSAGKNLYTSDSVASSAYGLTTSASAKAKRDVNADSSDTSDDNVSVRLFPEADVTIAHTLTVEQLQAQQEQMSVAAKEKDANAYLNGSFILYFREALKNISPDQKIIMTNGVNELIALIKQNYDEVNKTCYIRALIEYMGKTITLTQAKYVIELYSRYSSQIDVNNYQKLSDLLDLCQQASIAMARGFDEKIIESFNSQALSYEQAKKLLDKIAVVHAKYYAANNKKYTQKIFDINEQYTNYITGKNLSFADRVVSFFKDVPSASNQMSGTTEVEMRDMSNTSSDTASIISAINDHNRSFNSDRSRSNSILRDTPTKKPESLFSVVRRMMSRNDNNYTSYTYVDNDIHEPFLIMQEKETAMSSPRNNNKVKRKEKQTMMNSSRNNNKKESHAPY